MTYMIKAVLYLIAVLAVYASLGVQMMLGNIFVPEAIQLAVYCGICGGIGGVTYCLRGVYLNACVFDRWSEKWLPWYFIRPIVSFNCGVVSFIFLKSGLVVLEAQQSQHPTNLAFYALAFIAGLNVDKFIEKLEDIAQVTWGIKKSRVASNSDEK
jgi:hypothetical protein